MSGSTGDWTCDLAIKDYFRPDIHLLRSAIITSITTSVGMGLFLNRKRNPELVPTAWPADRSAPFVEIIIPARDEEQNIEPLLESLITQRYPEGRCRITVVDDGSTDRTPWIVSRYAAQHPYVRLVQTAGLPSDWTGKNNAMHTGYVESDEGADYLLFVDADTRHDPLMLSTVVQRAEELKANLLSLVIRVEMKSFWERLMIPQVGEMYTLLVGTMDSVNTGDSESGAAANGQFMLMTRDAYGKAIAEPGVHSDVAEDRAIAAALKHIGMQVRLEYGGHIVRARVYSSLSELWRGYSKTMFWASGHNVTRTLLVAGALALYAFMPLLSLGSALLRKDHKGRSSAIRHAPVQLLPMVILRAFVMKSMGVPVIYALLYPLAVGVGDAMLLFSFYRVVSGKGVTWKGRTYR
ncbi:MAG: glycosyltransferase family 2 protein [Chloroflexia bacterium]